MKIKFDSNQDFQLDAIRSVVDVFAGQPLTRASLQWQNDALGGELLTEMGVGNSLVLSDEAILRNVRKIQTENELEPAAELQGLNFSVEMETGTGKTYVYLRTLFELNTRYGWKKFIIVVPSVAIREGVLNAIELTKEHFQSLYGNAPPDYWVYDSAQVSKLRQFSASNQMQLMVMNIQAFDKSSTVIQNTKNQMNGRRPIEFIQHARPVVVLDEPQNLATELRTKAVESLNPLCTLRYSATHKDYFNLVYRLDPVKAYDLRLVKRIEVDSVVDGGDFNRPDWFKVETPLGTYNPDWAIVKEEQAGQNKVYLVRETKGTSDPLKLPEIQWKKIKCGKAHFKAVGLKDDGYDWVASASEV